MTIILLDSFVKIIIVKLPNRISAMDWTLYLHSLSQLNLKVPYVSNLVNSKFMIFLFNPIQS